MPTRSIESIRSSLRDDIADLVTRRPLPGPGLDQIDPFLFLNHHGPQIYPPGNHGLPFGPHPHRGFETVTFILDGSLAHRDSGGHESIIDAGGIQWMTAGRGIEHSELSPAQFRRDGGRLEIIQLWVNLPSRLKMTEPRYFGRQRSSIPEVATGGASVAVVSGRFGGSSGAVETITDVTLLVVRLEPGESVELPAPKDHNVLFYVVGGSVAVSDATLGPFRLALFRDDGDRIAVRSDEGGTVLFGHAPPIGEPVVAAGPFVMNSPEEIVQAVRDYEEGRFTS